jgi:large subunit ribosomal protein L1
MGRRSFEEQALQENIQAFIDFVGTLKPSAAKGAFVKKATLSSTHSPGIPLRV